MRDRYQTVRAQTMALIQGLSAEDCMVQSMPEASPVKWHLAHVTWFFETLVLETWLPRLGQVFRPVQAEFRVLFNSYYVGVGAFHPRAERGVLSRPSLDEVLQYRVRVDEQMQELLSRSDLPEDLLRSVELGLHHEQQHQELILTDLKHHWSRNPLLPSYSTRVEPPATPHDTPAPLRFVEFAGGHASIGHDDRSFGFDNECPRHGVWLEPFALATRLVSHGEYQAFVDDGGYQRPELWLSDGWDLVRQARWSQPLYWNTDTVFTLTGVRAPRPGEPVCHVSYYEADAYARWAGARLASEAEWEHAAQLSSPSPGNMLESGLWHPAAAPPADMRLTQMFGDTWEWTQSAYLPYPGFRPRTGAASEYNGKFMINQMVLRGGSCATPASHIRASYRNFFTPSARWQFTGIRLARDLSG